MTRSSFITLKNQRPSQFYIDNRPSANGGKQTSAPASKAPVKKMFVPTVEIGEAVDFDPQSGFGHFGSHKYRDLVRFWPEGACRAVVKDGRIELESLGDDAHPPTEGLVVMFFAGHPPGREIASTHHWCSEASWLKAEERLGLMTSSSEQALEPVSTTTPAPVRQIEQVFAPGKPRTHGQERVKRVGLSGRKAPAAKSAPAVVPTEDPVAELGAAVEAERTQVQQVAS